MFASLDARNGSRRRRLWTTLVSYALEVAACALLIAFPLIHTSALSHPRWIGPIVAPTSAGSGATQPHGMRRPVGRATTLVATGAHVLITPGQVPRHIDLSPDPNPPIVDGYEPSIVGSIPGPPGGNDLISRLVGEGGRMVAPSPPPQPVVLRLSHVDPGSLIYQVQPVYPQVAVIAHVEGPVVLTALIGRDGTIQHLRAVSGHPLLVPAALAAVSQWRYRPYVLNGEALAIETQVTVHFVLHH